jgi:heat shock protein 4
MDEIRAVAGPIVQRYFDKVEAERAEAQAIADAEAAKKREQAEKARAAALAQEQASKPDKPDEEMPDAETVKPDEITEPEK